MNTRLLTGLLVALSSLLLNARGAADSMPKDRAGLRCISRTAFPVPPGTTVLLESNFESGEKLPAGWGRGGGEIVAAADAPEGKAYLRLKAKKSSGLNSPTVAVPPGAPCLLSFWINTAMDPWTTISFTSDEREPSFTTIHSPIFYQDFPLDTHGEWRQEGFYFMVPVQCKTVQVHISPRENGADGQFVSLDDVRLRTVTADEIQAAYQAERANFPPYAAKSQPGDGKNLALSVAKWEGKAGIPGKPFVIWALGSSFTDREGDGSELIRAIRERFPHAPQIIYHKHGGPGEPWEFIDGWIRQFVAAEQPDLIFSYTSGTLEGLDAMLADIRRRTTADIIIPSLHFKPDSTMTAEDIEHGAGVQWDKVREICEKHGAEFVDSRREMADYIKQAGLVPDDLLADHNHQNMHRRIRIWDNVSAHLVESNAVTENPASRERRISLTPPANNATEQESLSGPWKTGHGAVQSSAAGARLKVTFTGTQIDLIGRKIPGGGSAKVLIDGVPADQAAVFLMNYIQPNKPHAWRIPHAVDLGSQPVPQAWTITMTSDTGDFRLAGSVTGPDGTGNLAESFTSKSGQIHLDPKFWRQGRVEKKGQPVDYGVSNGDTFRFDVFRSAIGAVSFKAEQPGRLVVPLVRNLPNQKHTLELITNGDGEVTIEDLYVYQPPEK